MTWPTDFTKDEEQEALLDCPFCGSEAFRGWYSGSPIIGCKGEDCLVLLGGEEYSGTGRMLIDSWNKRVEK